MTCDVGDSGDQARFARPPLAEKPLRVDNLYTSKTGEA